MVKPKEGESGNDHPSGVKNMAKLKEQMNEITERESTVEIETPMQRPKARGGRPNKHSVNISANQLPLPDSHPSGNSSHCRVPEIFMKEQVNPVNQAGSADSTLLR